MTGWACIYHPACVFQRRMKASTALTVLSFICPLHDSSTGLGQLNAHCMQAWMSYCCGRPTCLGSAIYARSRHAWRVVPCTRQEGCQPCVLQHHRRETDSCGHGQARGEKMEFLWDADLKMSTVHGAIPIQLLFCQSCIGSVPPRGLQGQAFVPELITRTSLAVRDVCAAMWFAATSIPAQAPRCFNCADSANTDQVRAPEARRARCRGAHYRQWPG